MNVRFGGWTGVERQLSRTKKLLTTVAGRFRPHDLRLRPLRIDDDAALDLIFDDLSARSRFLRFHAATPRLTMALRRGMLDVDGTTRLGLVAEAATDAGWHPMGIAHLIGTGPRNAEFAVVVVDRCQGRGVGRALLEELRRRAVELGFEHLHGDVLVDNHAMLRLAKSALPGSRIAVDGDIASVSHDLRAGALVMDLTVADLMADLVA